MPKGSTKGLVKFFKTIGSLFKKNKGYVQLVDEFDDINIQRPISERVADTVGNNPMLVGLPIGAVASGVQLGLNSLGSETQVQYLPDEKHYDEQAYASVEDGRRGAEYLPSSEDCEACGGVLEEPGNSWEGWEADFRQTSQKRRRLNMTVGRKVGKSKIKNGKKRKKEQGPIRSRVVNKHRSGVNW